MCTTWKVRSKYFNQLSVHSIFILAGIRECSDEWNPARPQMPLQNMAPTFLSSWMFCSVLCHFKHPGMCTDMDASSPNKFPFHFLDSIQILTPLKLPYDPLQPAHKVELLPPFLCTYSTLSVQTMSDSVWSTGKTHLDLSPSSSTINNVFEQVISFCSCSFFLPERSYKENLHHWTVDDVNENPHKTQSVEHGMQ